MEQYQLYRLNTYGASKAVLQQRASANYASQVRDIMNTNTLEQQVKAAHQKKLSTLGTIGSVGASVTGFTGGLAIKAGKKAKEKLTKKSTGENDADNEGVEPNETGEGEGNVGEHMRASDIDENTPLQDFLYGRRELGEADRDPEFEARFAEDDDEEIAGETERIFGGRDLFTPDAPSAGETGLARLTEGGTQTQEELPARFRSGNVEEQPNFRASELESADPDFDPPEPTEPPTADIVGVETLGPEDEEPTGISRLEPSTMEDDDPYAVFRSASDGGRGFLNPESASQPDSAPNFFGRLFGKTQNSRVSNAGSGEFNPSANEGVGVELPEISEAGTATGEGAEVGAGVAEGAEVATGAAEGAEVAGAAAAGTAEAVAVGADATAAATAAIPFLDIATAAVAGIATAAAIGIGAYEGIKTLESSDTSGKQVESKIAGIEQPPVQAAGKYVGTGGNNIYT